MTLFQIFTLTHIKQNEQEECINEWLKLLIILISDLLPFKGNSGESSL